MAMQTGQCEHCTQQVKVNTTLANQQQGRIYSNYNKAKQQQGNSDGVGVYTGGC